MSASDRDELALSDPGPRRADLLAEPEAVLSGTAAWSDGHAQAGLTVLGWPRFTTPREDDVLALLAGQTASTASLVRSTTDEQGRFALRGVLPGRVYLLTAGAPGLLGRSALAATRGRYRGPARLLVRAHYAVLVDRLDQGGAPIRRPLASFGPEYILRSPAPAGDVAAAPLDPIQRVLLGVSEGSRQRASSAVLLSYRTDSDESAVGPVIFHALQPGFESQSLELSVPRTSSGLQVVNVFMKPDDSPRGRIVIQLLGWDASDQLSGMGPGDSAAATLKLRDTATGRSSDCPIRVAGPDPIVLDGVPYGSYSAVLHPRDTLARLQPLASEDIVVGPAAAALIFDVRSLGRIEIELSDDVSRLLPGRAMFNVFSRPQGFNSYTAFQSPPYVLAQVTPGDYTVFLYALLEPEGTGSRTVDVTVRAGATTRVKIGAESDHEAPYEIPGARR